VDSETEQAIGRVRENLERSGSSLEKAGLLEDKLKEDIRPNSEKRVKEMLILEKIAKKEKIVVEEDDLEQGYKDVAARLGQDFDITKKFYEARNMADFFKEKLLEEKTLNYLVANANITEVERDALSRQEGTEEEVK
jgi:trigger factor